MFQLIQAETAEELWLSASQHFLQDVGNPIQPSRAGNTSEILHAALSIAEPRQRWISARQPAVNVAFALVETVWILRGRNDAAFLNFFNRSLPDYAGSESVYHGAYGHRLRSSFGLDQLQRAYDAFRHNKDTRQIVLQIWDPEVDLPDPTGHQAACDIPCNLCSILKIRNGRLEWTQIMRSNDFYRGLPYNIVQFTTLQEVIAGWLGVEIGEYHHISDSLHLYEVDAQYLGGGAIPEFVANNDSMALTKEASDNCFKLLEALILRIIDPGVSAEEIFQLVTSTSMPRAYKNQALIIAAEGVRRRREKGMMLLLVSECSNPALQNLFRLWTHRFDT